MQNQLPSEIRATYVLVVFFVLLLIVFFIIVVVVYNRRRIIMVKEKQVQEAEMKNTLLQKEIERQKALQSERERISHDMHDDLGAGISALKLQAQFLKEQLSTDNPLIEDIDLMIKTSDAMNHSMREMLWSLDNTKNNLQEFVHYISDYGHDFFRHSGIHFRFSSDIDDGVVIKPIARRHIFLCVKEAFNNILKHSAADEASVTIAYDNEVMTIDILDNGVGLKSSDTQGYGQQSMVSRMTKLGGTLVHVSSSKGCHLRFTLTRSAML